MSYSIIRRYEDIDERYTPVVFRHSEDSCISCTPAEDDGRDILFLNIPHGEETSPEKITEAVTDAALGIGKFTLAMDTCAGVRETIDAFSYALGDKEPLFRIYLRPQESERRRHIEGLDEYISENLICEENCLMEEDIPHPMPVFDAIHLPKASESRRKKRPLASFGMAASHAMEELPILPAESAFLGTGLPSPEDMHRYLDESFSQMVLRLIDEKGLTDPQVYKKANVDRKLFSKLRSNPYYKPSKRTALALAIGLELGREETDELLNKAGFSLSKSDIADVIVAYYIGEGIFDIIEINTALYSYDQQTLN